MDELELESSFVEVFKGDDVTDLVGDGAELLIDALLTPDGLAKDIPIAGSFIKIAHLVHGVSEKRFQRKIIRFLTKTAEIPEDKRVEFIIDLEGYTKEKAGAYLIAFIERLDESKKIDLIANLLVSKTENKITIEGFLRLSFMISQIFYYDLIQLPKYQKIQNTQDPEFSHLCADALGKIGLIHVDDRLETLNIDGVISFKSNVALTPLGLSMLEYAFKISLF